MFSRFAGYRLSLRTQISLIASIAILFGAAGAIGVALVYARFAGRDEWSAVILQSNSPDRTAWRLCAFMIAGAVLVSVASVSIWVRRCVSRPLGLMNQSARELRDAQNVFVLPEMAAEEIMRLSRAIDALKQQARGSRERRTQALAALSHDMRLPLTRLRLRAERSPAASREAMLREIDGMTRMIEMTLAAVREDAISEAKTRVDLASLLQTICNEFADVGHDVRYRGPMRLIWTCAPDTLARAISNLVDNSTKHGSQVVVELRMRPGRMEIDVSDDGPGIAASLNEAVFDPFFRLDPRSSGARRGFGLGLSIARDIVRDHGGDIELLQNVPHGLRARVTLTA